MVVAVRSRWQDGDAVHEAVRHLVVRDFASAARVARAAGENTLRRLRRAAQAARAVKCRQHRVPRRSF
eukprot:2652881-Prymnesium_polylepis.1